MFINPSMKSPYNIDAVFLMPLVCPSFPIPVNCIEAKTELKSMFMVCIAYRNIVTNLARRCCLWSPIQEQREA